MFHSRAVSEELAAARTAHRALDGCGGRVERAGAALSLLGHGGEILSPGVKRRPEATDETNASELAPPVGPNLSIAQRGQLTTWHVSSVGRLRVSALAGLTWQ